MRIRAGLAALALAALTAACGGGPTTDLDAAGVIEELAARGLPAKLTVTYTADTDPNKLLGRPNGYTSKAAFADERAKNGLGEEGDVALGGGVEVFEDADAAETRAEYIQGIGKSMPALGEYTYTAGNVLLRVSKELNPDDAAAYQQALAEIVR